jgi:hypothetical protein
MKSRLGQLAAHASAVTGLLVLLGGCILAQSGQAAALEAPVHALSASMAANATTPSAAVTAVALDSATAAVNPVFKSYNGTWYGHAVGGQLAFYDRAGTFKPGKKSWHFKAGAGVFRWGGSLPCTAKGCPNWILIQFTLKGHTKSHLNGKVIATNNSLFKVGDKVYLQFRPSTKHIRLVTTTSDPANLCRTVKAGACRH